LLAECGDGFVCSALHVPGCVVRHRDPRFAVYLVTQAIEAWQEITGQAGQAARQPEFVYRFD
jgi:hypothetical protein